MEVLCISNIQEVDIPNKDIPSRVHLPQNLPTQPSDYKLCCKNATCTIASVKHHVRQKIKVGISISQVYRAKRKAIDLITGDEQLQYGKLRSRVILQTEMEDENVQPRFKRMYIRYNAQKVGFSGGCKPIIGIDRCHLKGKFGGKYFLPQLEMQMITFSQLHLLLLSKRTKIHGCGFCNSFQMTLGIQSNLIWSSSLIDKRYDFSSIPTYLTYIFKVQ